MRCEHIPTQREAIRNNECTCCGRFLAELWLCLDCIEETE